VKGKDMHSLRKLDWIINMLLIATALFALTRVAWGLDKQDIVMEWTTEHNTR